MYMYVVVVPEVGTHCENVEALLQPKAPGKQVPDRTLVVGLVPLFICVELSKRRTRRVRWGYDRVKGQGDIQRGLACTDAKRRAAVVKERANFILMSWKLLEVSLSDLTGGRMDWIMEIKRPSAQCRLSGFIFHP